MKKIYAECPPWVRPNILEKYPSAIFVPNEGHLWAKAHGIKEALHNVHAPQEGPGWKVLQCSYYTSVVQVEEGKD